ncbi:hypothetical protein HDU67_001619 [Dinochytrium kinnereticum]|nr:hypothetical protein HDU67_001619 [Dinochytrium kinnereticum]
MQDLVKKEKRRHRNPNQPPVNDDDAPIITVTEYVVVVETVVPVPLPAGAMAYQWGGMQQQLQFGVGAGEGRELPYQQPREDDVKKRREKRKDGSPRVSVTRSGKRKTRKSEKGKKNGSWRAGEKRAISRSGTRKGERKKKKVAGKGERKLGLKKRQEEVEGDGGDTQWTDEPAWEDPSPSSPEFVEDQPLDPPSWGPPESITTTLTTTPISTIITSTTTTTTTKFESTTAPRHHSHKNHPIINLPSSDSSQPLPSTTTTVNEQKGLLTDASTHIPQTSSPKQHVDLSIVIPVVSIVAIIMISLLVGLILLARSAKRKRDAAANPPSKKFAGDGGDKLGEPKPLFSVAIGGADKKARRLSSTVKVPKRSSSISIDRSGAGTGGDTSVLAMLASRKARPVSNTLTISTRQDQASLAWKESKLHTRPPPSADQTPSHSNPTLNDDTTDHHSIKTLAQDPNQSDSVSSSLSSISTIPSESGNDYEFRYEVVVPWIPQRFDELPLAPGEMVVVYKVYEDGWCDGKLVSNNEEGVFPMACLRGRAWSFFGILETENAAPAEEEPAIAGVRESLGSALELSLCSMGSADFHQAAEVQSPVLEETIKSHVVRSFIGGSSEVRDSSSRVNSGEADEMSPVTAPDGRSSVTYELAEEMNPVVQESISVASNGTMTPGILTHAQSPPEVQSEGSQMESSAMPSTVEDRENPSRQ